MANSSFNQGRALKSTVTGRAARNDVTGALIKTAPATDAYRNAPFWCRGNHTMDPMSDRCTECGLTKQELEDV
ncbi:MAG: hypothetical protein GWN58_19840 [Anaerolineae bacterium]|nr:hypothetical protein [Anaerolineae bacterium]